LWAKALEFDGMDGADDDACILIQDIAGRSLCKQALSSACAGASASTELHEETVLEAMHIRIMAAEKVVKAKRRATMFKQEMDNKQIGLTLASSSHAHSWCSSRGEGAAAAGRVQQPQGGCGR
jgi:hypothetical protein